MICDEKEQLTCQQEKLGCKGCYYNKPSKEEIEKAKEDIKNLRIRYLSVDYSSSLSQTNINNLDILFQYINQLEFQIEAKEKEHKYDVNMIDGVKGEAVKLHKEIRKLNKIIDEILKAWKQDDYRSIEEIKQYFEKKVESKNE